MLHTVAADFLQSTIESKFCTAVMLQQLSPSGAVHACRKPVG